MANLKDIKNPSLKENVLRGLIPADRIARMTAEVRVVEPLCIKAETGFSTGHNNQLGPEAIKFFSCSLQLSINFILLINVKMLTLVSVLMIQA